MTTLGNQMLWTLMGLTLSSVVLAQNTNLATTAPTASSTTTPSESAAPTGGPPGSGAFFSGHIRSVTAITEVYGAGQRATAAVVEYDRPVLNSALSKAAFTITGRTIWDGTSSPAQFKADVAALLKARPDSNVHYAAFKQGTVIPAGQSIQGAAGHTNTWRIACTIEGIRDWLFAQHQ